MRISSPEINALIISEPKSRYVYADKVRTEQRILGADGKPESQVRAVIAAPAMGFTEATLRFADDLAPQIATGAVVIVRGTSQGATLSGADFGGIRVVVDGIEAVEYFADFASAFAGAKK